MTKGDNRQSRDNTPSYFRAARGSLIFAMVTEANGFTLASQANRIVREGTALQLSFRNIPASCIAPKIDPARLSRSPRLECFPRNQMEMLTGCPRGDRSPHWRFNSAIAPTFQWRYFGGMKVPRRVTLGRDLGTIGPCKVKSKLPISQAIMLLNPAYPELMIHRLTETQN